MGYPPGLGRPTRSASWRECVSLRAGIGLAVVLVDPSEFRILNDLRVDSVPTAMQRHVHTADLHLLFSQDPLDGGTADHYDGRLVN